MVPLPPFAPFTQMEPLGNKTDKQDFTAGIALKCPEKVSLLLHV